MLEILLVLALAVSAQQPTADTVPTAGGAAVEVKNGGVGEYRGVSPTGETSNLTGGPLTYGFRSRRVSQNTSLLKKHTSTAQSKAALTSQVISFLERQAQQAKFLLASERATKFLERASAEARMALATERATNFLLRMTRDARPLVAKENAVKFLERTGRQAKELIKLEKQRSPKKTPVSKHLSEQSAYEEGLALGRRIRAEIESNKEKAKEATTKLDPTDIPTSGPEITDPAPASGAEPLDASEPSSPPAKHADPAVVKHHSKTASKTASKATQEPEGPAVVPPPGHGAEHAETAPDPTAPEGYGSPVAESPTPGAVPHRKKQEPAQSAQWKVTRGLDSTQVVGLPDAHPDTITPDIMPDNQLFWEQG